MTTMTNNNYSSGGASGSAQSATTTTSSSLSYAAGSSLPQSTISNLQKEANPDFAPDNNYKPGEIKIILVGDSAVGKSKLVERFLCDSYTKHTASTYAVNIFSFTHTDEKSGKKTFCDIWDTAGQEQFNNLHPSFFYDAHVAILVFDVTRKITYKNLDKWYQSCLEYCLGGGGGNGSSTCSTNCPVLCIANKIDSDPSSTTKKFHFASKNNLPFFYVSAADGTNVVRIFEEAISLAKLNKEGKLTTNGGGGGDVLMNELLALIRDDDNSKT